MKLCRHPLVTLVITLFLFPVQAGIDSARANDANVAVWKKPVPGTHAFLGDDGGGVNVATVCGTAERYRRWLKMESSPGCQTFQHDLSIIIELVILDRAADTIAGTWLPLAKIKIPSEDFTGYIQLLGLHPAIPSGTVIHFKRIENGHIQFFDSPKVTDKPGTDLGDSVSVTVLHYDPRPDDEWDLRVRINDGRYVGKTGWMMSFGGDLDGEPVDQFSDAVISNKQPF